MEPGVEDFHHPYSPYDIQLQFMRALYDCLEEGKVAIFESPTGTGKSLSLICGSLTWLRDHKRKAFYEALNNTIYNDDDEPDWMVEFAKRESARAVTEKRKELEARLVAIRQEEERQKNALRKPDRPHKRQRFHDTSLITQNEEHFTLEDYDSEHEERRTLPNSSDNYSGLSASTIELLERFKGKYVSHSREDNDGMDEIKIFYCSRTHSQLTQFANELRRVTVPSSIPAELRVGAPQDEELQERIKHLSLGSRKNLCINSQVTALENPTAINERCLDLQQPGTTAQQKCPFLPLKDDETLATRFRDHALATVKDIEDLGNLGRKIGVCPYYASRSAVKHTEIVTLPYPLLLQRSAREALDLSIKGHVVIIDEAHNLMDAISNIHSVTVTLSQLQLSISQLTTYARKFKNRLKGKNRTYIAQVIRLITSISDHLQQLRMSTQASEGPVKPSDIMSGKGVDQINPYKLSRYLQESKLARKVDGYVEFSKERSDPANLKPASPVLFHIQSFLLPLMNLSDEGRLFYVKSSDDIQLNYMLLDPTNHFREIVEDARAVILAGGTMSPMTDYMDHLLSYVPSSRLESFSYGHVIPSGNLIARTLAKGVHGSDFDFTYDSRNSEQMIIDLGRTIVTLCQVIPDGVVAFFPSYDYLSRVVGIWKKTVINGRDQTLYNLVEQKKPVLLESRDMPTSTEELLNQYSESIASGQGALLLSVVGGKLSEGINFSDKLGRGVLIVGLPFPNIRSAVWQAKIQYIEQKAYRQSLGQETDRQLKAKAAGREFYENSCMRAVNQSIGRAIRHRNDYAAIILIDKRYAKRGIQGKLPAWIKQSMGNDESEEKPAGPTIGSLSKFFAARKAQQP